MRCTMKTAALLIVFGFLASILSINATGDKPCPANLTAHPTPIHSWSKGKEFNIIFMGLPSLAQLAQLLTGGSKTDILEEPCLKCADDNNATNLNMRVYGYKAKAVYECTFPNNSIACHATPESTNAELAQKHLVGFPMPLWSDDKSYALEVRCPPGQDQMWYVKSIHEALSLEDRNTILHKVKELGLFPDHAASFDNTECEKIYKA